MVEEPYASICRDILALDDCIRASAITNHVGEIMALVYRRDLVPLLTRENMDRYAATNIIATLARELFESRTGKLQYTTSTYEKFIDATIPVMFESKRDRLFLLVSMDNQTDYRSIIEDKILAYMQKPKMT